MTATFTFTPTSSGTEFRLVIDGVAQPHELWPVNAPTALMVGVELLMGLVAADRADAGDDTVLVEDAAIADLSAREAALLGLPPLVDAAVRVETSGLITSPAFKVTLQWLRPATRQPIVAPQRTGAWLKIGGEYRRLSAALFAIAEAVDAVGRSAEAPADRLVAIGRLKEILPGADASVTGMVASVEVIQADAFSLDAVGEGAALRLVPILHRAGSEEPLLPPDLQTAFGDRQFNDFTEVRPVYALSGGRYVVLTPVLRRALGVVRHRQGGTSAAKRGLLAAPRAVLRAALEADDDPTLVEALEPLFVETQAYSDRVIGLGLWTPRVVPWVMRVGTDWFGPDLPGGLVVGGRRIELTPAQAEDWRQKVEDARGRGEPTITVTPDGGDPVVLPATPETQQALTELVDRRRPPRPDGPPGGKPERKPAESLLILTNEETVEHEKDFFDQRQGPAIGLPAMLETQPKPHQHDGIAWLQKCWLKGRPGVLLADDMGLGKTLQGLAFLAWLRDGMAAGTVPRAPVLIVAPTGLLANWLAEHECHLRGLGLGTCVAAYGGGLRDLRRVDADGTVRLDGARLAAADWVLTTYETLRDHDRDFGAVRFAVLLADEAQKVKTPAARITDALKGMNADFRIAMTGTPVENRLADLWCIVDGVHSGFLGDLKGFSRRYEADADLERLAELKRQLDQPMGGAPALLLRRMKDDQLPDLPKAEARIVEAPLPAFQAAAYAETIAAARNTDRKGAVLEALQRLRAIALHPQPDMPADDDAFIAASARLRLCIEALDGVAAAGERALIFLDSLAMQSKLAGLIQRRYRLPRPPAIISGEVAGEKRQRHVDAFQDAPAGFGAMILSPRAGGVGLTLTRANHVIHLARWWNPAVEDQCTGRALRIGQTRTVHVHIPIGVLPDGRRSFDQNLHALLERKRHLMREALLPPGFTEGEQQQLLDETMG